MKDQYTSGPWTICKCPLTGKQFIEHRTATHKFLVAQVHGDDCRDANARLIAAAPELLEACQLMLKRWDALNVENLGPGCRDIGERVKAAIEKAQGEA